MIFLCKVGAGFPLSEKLLRPELEACWGVGGQCVSRAGVVSGERQRVLHARTPVLLQTLSPWTELESRERLAV